MITSVKTPISKCHIPRYSGGFNIIFLGGCLSSILHMPASSPSYTLKHSLSRALEVCCLSGICVHHIPFLLPRKIQGSHISCSGTLGCLCSFWGVPSSTTSKAILHPSLNGQEKMAHPLCHPPSHPTEVASSTPNPEIFTRHPRHSRPMTISFWSLWLSPSCPTLPKSSYGQT